MPPSPSVPTLRDRLYAFLRWTERYTKTDMVYLVQGGGWLFLEQAAAALITLGVGVVFGHYASKDLYGNYKYVLALGTLLSAFSLSGISTAITRAVAQGREGAFAQGVLLALRFSSGIPVLALGAGLYYFLQGNLFVALGLCIVAIFAPLINSLSLFDSFLVGRKEFGRSTAYSICSNVLVSAALIAALLLSHRAIYVVLAYFVMNALLDAFFYWRSVRRARNAEGDPDLPRYGFHLSIMAAISTISSTIDSIAIFTLLGPAALAVYAYAIAIPAQMTGLLKNIVPLSSPKFAQRSFTDIQRGIWGRLGLLAAVSALGILAYIAVAPFLYRILFPVYMSSVPYSRAFAISIAFVALTYPLTSALQAHQKIRALHFASNTGPIMLIATLPALTYFWGLEGAILSQLISRLAGLGMTLWQFARAKDAAVS
jgi:O-antigen/teichoic acid export membrane protein